MASSPEYIFSSGKTICITEVDWKNVRQHTSHSRIIFITDANLYELYKDDFIEEEIIVFPAGEENKTIHTVDFIIGELIKKEADKNCLLVGFGGGVVTDVTGFVASVYKRRIPFAFIPASLMAMADAAIGGKNGVNSGAIKNIIGTVTQPEFILFDYDLLKTLPGDEWINGMAEIIKYGCIKDAELFAMLEKYTMDELQSDIFLTAQIIERCIGIKMKIVVSDEYDRGERRILNFGHTIGHAIERLHDLPHGYAISIGMVAACSLSEKLCELHFRDAARIVQLLAKYHLPVDVETDHSKVEEVIRLDKKRSDNIVQFILLEKIGKALVHPVELHFLQSHLKEII